MQFTVEEARKGRMLFVKACVVLQATLPDAVAALERDLIEEALRLHDGNASKAAQALGIHRNALARKLERAR